MGHIDQFDMLSGLAGVELALLDLGYQLEPGKGLAAAQQVLAQRKAL
jgi:aspartate aminotransferase-like enzyme